MGDNITKPDHYCDGRKYEPKDAIRDWGLNFNLGSAVKYISRAGRKGDKLEDLRKAKQFLEFEIEAEETEEHKDDIDMTCSFPAAGCLKRLGCITSKNIMRGYTDDVFEGIRSFNSLYDEYKPRVDDKKVLDVFYELTDEQKKIVCCMIGNAVKYERYKALVIQDMSKKDSMTCKEAAAIGDAIAKGFKDGIKESEENSDIKIEAVNESLINGYVSGILSRVVGFNSIHEEYKPRVIDKITQKVLDNTYDFEDIPEDIKSRVLDKIAQEVLDSQCDIVRDIPTNEHRQLVIDRIVEMIDNGYFDRMDIPTSLYEDCRRILSAIASREYHKQKERSQAEDAVSINFEFEIDPEIDTDTVNVHVHIKNKED